MSSGGFGGVQALKEEVTEAVTAEETSAPAYVLERSTPVQKMPISYLQEMCTKREVKPEYELLSTEGQVRMTDDQVHEPTFMFRVTVNDLSAVGQGKSKKTAKHLAAKALLERIVAVGRFKDFGMGETQAEAQETLRQLADISSAPAARVSGGSGGEETAAAAGASVPVAAINSASSTGGSDDGGDAAGGNPVGRLQEMCQQKKWPAPTYELSSEDGPPHERTFVISISLGKFSAEGSGRSKKNAKREAADKLLKFLDKLPAEQQRENIGVTEEDELAENFERAMTLLGHKVKPATADEQRLVGSFFETLKQDSNDCFEALRSLPLSLTSNYAQLLQRIGQSCHFEITFLPDESRSAMGDYQCLVQLNAMPVAVCYGRGATAEDARQSAAYNALEYLKIMTKN